jgi:hypothetical protein
MTRTTRSQFYALLALCLAIQLYVPAPSVMAQTTFQQPFNDVQRKIEYFMGIEFEHSDNIFGLTDTQEPKMAANDPENWGSGRYSHMESISDNIVSPALGLKYDFKWLNGEDLKLSAGVRYNSHTENQEKSYPEAGISLKNKIGKKGVLTLEGDFLFLFFSKNYFTGYDDENDNGNISKDERIYSSAYHNEYEGTLSYNYLLFKDNDMPLSRVEMKPFLGYSTRYYNYPFSNRCRNILFKGLELTVSFFSRIDLGLGYLHENASYPGEDELVLYDETLSEIDTNEDGEIVGNAPLVTPIDRSFNRHTLEVNPAFDISKDFQFYLGYEIKVSEYTSDNPLDVDHFNQISLRKRIKAGIEYDFSKSWSSEIEYRQTEEENEEEGNYSENSFIFSIKHNLPE